MKSDVQLPPEETSGVSEVVQKWAFSAETFVMETVAPGTQSKPVITISEPTGAAFLLKLNDGFGQAAADAGRAMTGARENRVAARRTYMSLLRRRNAVDSIEHLPRPSR